MLPGDDVAGAHKRQQARPVNGTCLHIRAEIPTFGGQHGTAARTWASLYKRGAALAQGVRLCCEADCVDSKHCEELCGKLI
jgi:hypothetical protein